MLPAFCWYWYLLIARPPSKPADHDSSTCALPAFAVRLAGLPGFVADAAGVAVALADQSLVPLAFVARTCTS